MSKLSSGTVTFTDSDQLLSTKLGVPLLRASLITRQRLLSQLDEGLAHKLTLVSAPAGFGKTTVVSEWSHKKINALREGRRMNDPKLDGIHTSALVIQPSKYAWVSLDPNDNDPVRFWRYVLTASQAFDYEVSQSALNFLNHSPEPAFESLLTMFINGLASLPGKAILILDDYHVITAPQIHKTMAFFLENLPPALHMILITRSDPPLPLARMQARNELNALRAEDLRFSLEEAEIFIQHAISTPVSANMLKRLSDRTEGWIAGLHLATLLLQRKKNPIEIQRFLDTFTGTLRPIQEYLVEEVFEAQPGHLQEFLLRTSIVSRLTGSLGDELTGRDDSSTLLDQLEPYNLFLAPLDASGEWYRFHALFSEAMQQYARQSLGEEQIHELQRKASLWYEKHGLLPEAVEAALASLDYARAAGLIQQIITPRITLNEHYTLRRWMEKLPKEVLHAYPTICMTYAVAILFTSDRHAPGTEALLQTPLQIAEEHWHREGNQGKLGEVLAFRALVAWLQRDPIRSFSLARQALEILPKSEVQWRGISLLFLGAEQLYADRLNQARQTLTEARAVLESAENIFGILDSLLLLCEVDFRQGKLHQAAHLYRQIIAKTENAPMNRNEALIRRGRALFGLSILALEENELKAAEEYLAEGLGISQQLLEEDALAHGPLILARIKYARGEVKQAQELLDRLTSQTRFPPLLAEVSITWARLALASGNTASVERFYAGEPQPADTFPSFHHEQQRLVLARLLMAQRKEKEALDLLQELLADAQANGCVRSEMEVNILMAMACAALKDSHQAKQALIRALELAQPEGHRRLFLDESGPLSTLMRSVLPDLRDGPMASFGRALLYTRAQQSSTQDLSEPDSVSSIEPLSEQELRVLRLLGSGLTNPEIAQELFVSLNTVKSHVKSIYRKLHVRGRSEARQVARNLNLA